MQFKRVIEAVSSMSSFYSRYPFVFVDLFPLSFQYFFFLLRVIETFPDPPKAAEDLSAFGKLNEKQLYKFLKTCMDPSSDVRSVGRAYVRVSCFIMLVCSLTFTLSLFGVLVDEPDEASE